MVFYTSKRAVVYLSCILPILFTGDGLGVTGNVNILSNNLSSIEQLLCAKSSSKHFKIINLFQPLYEVGSIGIPINR